MVPAPITPRHITITDVLAFRSVRIIISTQRHSSRFACPVTALARSQVSIARVRVLMSGVARRVANARRDMTLIRAVWCVRVVRMVPRVYDRVDARETVIVTTDSVETARVCVSAQVVTNALITAHAIR